jgi:hypothetical protein
MMQAAAYQGPQQHPPPYVMTDGGACTVVDPTTQTQEPQWAGAEVSGADVRVGSTVQVGGLPDGRLNGQWGIVEAKNGKAEGWLVRLGNEELISAKPQNVFLHRDMSQASTSTSYMDPTPGGPVRSGFQHAGQVPGKMEQRYVIDQKTGQQIAVVPRGHGNGVDASSQIESVLAPEGHNVPNPGMLMLPRSLADVARDDSRMVGYDPHRDIYVQHAQGWDPRCGSPPGLLMGPNGQPQQMRVMPDGSSQWIQTQVQHGQHQGHGYEAWREAQQGQHGMVAGHPGQPQMQGYFPQQRVPEQPDWTTTGPTQWSDMPMKVLPPGSVPPYPVVHDAAARGSHFQDMTTHTQGAETLVWASRGEGTLSIGHHYPSKSGDGPEAQQCRWHESGGVVGVISEDGHVFTKKAGPKHSRVSDHGESYELATICMVFDSSLRCGGVHRYQFQVLGGELGPADGAGFTFDSKVRRRPIQRMSAVFLNQRGTICLRQRQHVNKLPKRLPPLAVGMLLTMFVDLNALKVRFMISRDGYTIGSADVALGGLFEQQPEGAAEGESLHSGFFCAVVTGSVSVSLF